jgi:hypothetical protein
MKKIKQRIREWYLRSIIIDGNNPQMLFFFIFIIGAIRFSLLLQCIVYFLGLAYFSDCLSTKKHYQGEVVTRLSAASESRFFIMLLIVFFLCVLKIIIS